jgi:hypothetical protein
VLNEQYFWWQKLIPMHAKASNGTVPSYWSYRLTALNPEDEDVNGDMRPKDLEIFHLTAVEAIEGILDGDFSDESALPEGCGPVDDRTVRACEELRDDPEHGSTEFDHWISDEVLQVIAYGGIVF